MAFRALTKLAKNGSRQLAVSQLISREAAVAAPSSAMLQQARLLQTSRIPFQDAMENAMKESPDGTKWKENAILYDYTKESKPAMSPIPIRAFDSSAHESGESRVINLDQSKDLNTDWPATSMNMLSSFVRIKTGESLTTKAQATSQLFYVIRGDGYSDTEFGKVRWAQGDVFSVPATSDITHHASKESTDKGGAAFYWVSDEPLCKYLGVSPTEKKFEAAHYTKDSMMEAVNKLKSDPSSKDSNRVGVLLGTHQTAETKTATHVLWTLFNILPAKTTQKPHRHTPTALDFCVSAPKEGCYTAMAQNIDKDGNLIDPIKAPWLTGGAFTTPPGWWHIHVNETDEDAWVLPIQDAGLLTHQRILDIRFVPQVLETIKKQQVQGAAFEGIKSYV